MHKNFREESRAAWGRDVCSDPSQTITTTEIQLGAILRIADAAEVMAKNHNQLTDERDRYKRWYVQEKKCTERMSKQISGLRGYITKLKKKAGM